MRLAETASLIEELLRAGTSARFRVTGSSMHPAIRSGDIVTVHPCPAGRIRKGQVICFRHETEMRLHRIVAARGDSEGLFYLARGDALNEFTEKVRPQNILGLAVAVERNGTTVNFNPPFRRIFSAVRRLLRKMTN